MGGVGGVGHPVLGSRVRMEMSSLPAFDIRRIGRAGKGWEERRTIQGIDALLSGGSACVMSMSLKAVENRTPQSGSAPVYLIRAGRPGGFNGSAVPGTRELMLISYRQRWCILRPAENKCHVNLQ